MMAAVKGLEFASSHHCEKCNAVFIGIKRLGKYYVDKRFCRKCLETANSIPSKGDKQGANK